MSTICRCLKKKDDQIKKINKANIRHNIRPEFEIYFTCLNHNSDLAILKT